MVPPRHCSTLVRGYSPSPFSLGLLAVLDVVGDISLIPMIASDIYLCTRSLSIYLCKGHNLIISHYNTLTLPFKEALVLLPLLLSMKSLSESMLGPQCQDKV
jgi:hypothetical protein